MTTSFQEHIVAHEYKEHIVAHEPRWCQECFTRPNCSPVWSGGNVHRTLLPTKCFDRSIMESRSSSRRVFPLRRNPRCRNSSTRKMWISRFKIQVSKVFSSYFALSLFVNNKFIEIQSGGYFVCTRPDLESMVSSTQTPLHL